jgi:hypothetical protein
MKNDLLIYTDKLLETRILSYLIYFLIYQMICIFQVLQISRIQEQSLALCFQYFPILNVFYSFNCVGNAIFCRFEYLTK